MANVLCFSHSYRSPDAQVNAYFARLLESEGLTPSLDPPSNAVNSAKLERHLNYTDGMIAILAQREGGVSPHILYEITLGIRARKPLAVFVEDSLPNDIVPRRVLQQRFSRQSFLRQVREHRQTLQTLRSYLGGTPAPRYQPSIGQRTCLILASDAFDSSPASADLPDFIERDLRYAPVNIPTDFGILGGQAWWELMLAIDVVIVVHDAQLNSRSSYLLGAIRGALRPMISLTLEPDFRYSPDIPLEYQPRQILSMDTQAVREILFREFRLYEEDFLDFGDQTEVNRYADQLIYLDGQYSPGTRSRVMEVVMGDKYEVSGGQAGVVGPKAHVHGGINFNQIWGANKNEIDLGQLAQELEKLRASVRSEASTPEQDAVLAEIGQAQVAAQAADGPEAMSHLARAGRWALSVAEKIGVPLAVAAIRAAIGA
jgi:hypothetical protein